MEPRTIGKFLPPGSNMTILLFAPPEGSVRRETTIRGIP
jgi:hypothetical protein